MDPNIHIEERRDRRGKRLSSLALLTVIALLGGSVFGLFGFLELNAAFGTAQDLEERYICDPTEYELDFPEISRLSEVYTADGVLLGLLTERNSQPTSIADVPDTVKYAVLAAEDSNFYEHEGVDFRGIIRAAALNFRNDATVGGSTITQQVVKQNFLTDDLTIERKLCEAVIAAELEKQYTKDEILEYYMNSVFYGANAYGVKAAAQEYYGKDLAEVSVAEAAAMVVPIRNPSLYNLRENPEGVTRRRNDVIRQMVEKEFISPEQGEAALDEPLRVVPHEEQEIVSPQVFIAAREELLNNPDLGLGATYAERKKALFGCPASDTECEGGGGLKISVTVNKEWNDEATRILKSWFQDTQGPTGAIAMIENSTGALRVMASGTEFGTDIEAGERPYDLVTKGKRQAGSAFKTMGLVAALEYGAQAGWEITLGSFWDQTSPLEIDCGFPCGPRGNIWRVSNAGGGGSGVRSLESATAASTNVVYAQVAVAVGAENIVEMSHRLGIESPLAPVPSIVLGSQSVSPFEMASAYSTIANYGAKVDPYIIERIEDVDGNVVYEHETVKEQVIDPSMAAAVVETLEQIPRSGTGTAANIGRPSAGKTGTAQNYRDVWYVGFIPQYSTAVWSGYPDGQVELENFTVFNDVTGRPQHYSRAFGGTLTAPIWAQFMRYITEDLPERDFPDQPEGTSEWFRVPETTVPDVSGMKESEAKRTIQGAGLFANIEIVPSGEPKGTFLGQSPSPGATVKQGTRVTVRYSSGVLPTTPNLIGLRKDEVAGAITAHNSASGTNLSHSFANQPTDDRSLWGRVVSTSPGPGASISVDGTITVYIGVQPDDPPDDDGGDGDEDGGDDDGGDDGGG